MVDGKFEVTKALENIVFKTGIDGERLVNLQGMSSMHTILSIMKVHCHRVLYGMQDLDI